MATGNRRTEESFTGIFFVVEYTGLISLSVKSAGYRLYRFWWMKLWFLRKYAMPLWQRLKR